MTPMTPATPSTPTTRRLRVGRALASVYAVACFLAVLAPALAVRWTTLRSGVGTGGIAGWDLVAASAVVGAAHATTARARLRCEHRIAARGSHVWIASLNALVVLALSASLLVLGVLEHFAAEHAALANRGLPVVVLWAGLQLAAVGLAEATGRFVFWWLEPHPAPHRACRWGVLPPVRALVPLAALRRVSPRVPVGVGVSTASTPTAATAATMSAAVSAPAPTMASTSMASTSTPAPTMASTSMATSSTPAP
ncbi:MAG TPA: hypothetical protein VIL36_21940 [Acidimicrobiales bacterium]